MANALTPTEYTQARPSMGSAEVRRETDEQRRVRNENWSQRRDLNPRPELYESPALPLSYSGSISAGTISHFDAGPKRHVLWHGDFPRAMTGTHKRASAAWRRLLSLFARFLGISSAALTL